MIGRMSTDKTKTGIYWNLVVMRQHHKLRIVNIETFEGSLKGQNIECYGFNRDGKPVFKREHPIDYKFVGEFCGLVNLNSPFARTSKLQVRGQPEEYLYEYEGVGYFLCQKGIHIEAETVESEVKSLTSKGVTRIFVSKASESYGMTSECFTEVCGQDEKWIFSGKIPIPDYDLLWNQYGLPELKSKWRICNDRIQELLNKKYVAQIKI